MKTWDLNAPAAKLEVAAKGLRTTMTAVDKQWADQARRDFENMYLVHLDSNLRGIQDAIKRLAEVLASAQADCDSN